MKKYKTLSLLVAFCLLFVLLWHGLLLILEPGSRPTLNTVEGDSSALSNISLEGCFADNSIGYHFALKNGAFSAKPMASQKSISFFPQPWSASTTWHFTHSPDTPDRVGLSISGTAAEAYTYDSPKSSDENAAFHFNTNVSLSQADFDLISRAPSYVKDGTAESALAYELIPDGPVQYINGKLYGVVNLPWGGIQVYCIPDPARNLSSTDPAYFAPWIETENGIQMIPYENSLGTPELVLSLDGDTVTMADGLFPLGDKIILLGHTDAGEPMYHLDENSGLQPLPSPEKSVLTAYVYDQNFHLEQTLPLLDLPQTILSHVDVIAPGVASPDSRTLCLVLKIDDRVEPYYAGESEEQSEPIGWMGALALHLEDNGTLQLTNSLLYPSNLTSAQQISAHWASAGPRMILTAQTDSTGDRLAVITVPADRRPFPELDVYQNGTRIYRGVLQLTPDTPDSLTARAPYCHSFYEVFFPIRSDFMRNYNSFLWNYEF